MSDFPSAPLDDLPVQAAGLARAIPRAAWSLADAALVSRRTSPVRGREYVTLGTTRLAWRLYVVIREHERIFFFRRRGDERVVFRAMIELTFRAQEDAPRALSLLDETRFELLLPAFLELRPAPGRWREVGPRDAPAHLGDRLLIRTPAPYAGLLAVSGRDGFREAAFRFTPVTGRALEFTSRDDGWPAGPFVGVLAALHAWAAGDFAAGRTTPIRLDGEGRHGHSHAVLRTLAATYFSATTQLRTAFDETPKSLVPLVSAYGIGGFAAEVRMRLDEDGQLAADHDEDTFQLALRVRMHLAGEADPVPWVTVVPPDFLARGRLRERFVAALAREGGHLRRLSHQLDREAGIEVSAPALRAFIERSAARAMIFRMRRDGEDDVEAFVASGAVDGEPLSLAFKVNLELRDHQVVLDPDSVSLIAAARGDLQGQVLDGDSRRYMRRLLAAMHEWLSSVA